MDRKELLEKYVAAVKEHRIIEANVKNSKYAVFEV